MNVASNIIINGESGMNELGARLARGLAKGDAVLLHGEMGMGKSVLARAIGRAFGIKGAMPSPTFTILQIYEADITVKHFDLYRLEDSAEFYEAGLDEEMDESSLSLVEWPEMTDFLPEKRLDIYLRRGQGENERIADIEYTGIGPERIERMGFVI